MAGKIGNQQEQRRQGAWFGLAVGDALGAPYEFQTREQVRQSAPAKLTMSGGGPWEPGEFTDDTALTLATARAYRKSGFAPHKAAHAMVAWLKTDPKDVGNLTRVALSLMHSGEATPEQAGQKALSMYPGAAGNGSLMRALPTALVRAPFDERLKIESEVLGGMTHADARCQAACVAFNTIVASLIMHGDPHLAMQAGKQAVVHPEVKALIDHVLKGESPQYQDADGIGYVMLALERGLVALRDSTSFEQGVDAIVRMGGDADTNAAIGGALLGARFGIDSIPTDWREGLRDGATLHEAYTRLMTSRQGAPQSTAAPQSTSKATGAALQQRLDGMLEFLPLVADRKNFFQDQDGLVFTEEAERFLRQAADLKWVTPSVDWMAWMKTPESKAMMATDGAALAKASVRQLESLITALVRGERFATGCAIRPAYDNGTIARIFARMQVLSEDLKSPPSA